MVGILALASLTLLSVYFRESPEGRLHDAQGLGATALRPFQVGAERVARPFRDLYGWFDGLVTAKEENERLRAQLDRLRRQTIGNQTAAQENVELREALALKDIPRLDKYRRVNTRVIGYPPAQDGSEIVIAAGSDAGIQRHAPVLSGGALVGEVSEVAPHQALVTLVTDESLAVGARDLRSNATGLVEAGSGGSLEFNRVTKAKDVLEGDLVITAGSRDDRLPSLFPSGIPIGTVTSVGQSDTEPFKQIQVTPHVDLSSLYVVTVLVR